MICIEDIWYKEKYMGMKNPMFITQFIKNHEVYNEIKYLPLLYNYHIDTYCKKEYCKLDDSLGVHSLVFTSDYNDSLYLFQKSVWDDSWFMYILEVNS